MGAQTVLADDVCVRAALDEAGLNPKLEEDVRSPPLRAMNVGVWNGTYLTLHRKRDLRSRTCKEWARDLWKYGTAPRNIESFINEKLSKFRHLYREFPDDHPSLREMIQWHGLPRVNSRPKTTFLRRGYRQPHSSIVQSRFE